MTIAVLADVHGNLEALRAVMLALEQDGPERYYFLGDAVGYGPQPNECLELLRERCVLMLQGNHDAGAAGTTDTGGFNAWARQGLAYVAKVLTEEHRRYLKLLPYVETRHGATFAHASPFEPERWHYVLTGSDAQAAFRGLPGRLGFIAHTHIPGVVTQDPEQRFRAAPLATLVMDPHMRYLVNVGSVGQPRDGDPRASCVLYDEAAGTVTLKRVPYDVAAVGRKIVDAGLPPYLAERLVAGR